MSTNDDDRTGTAIVSNSGEAVVDPIPMRLPPCPSCGALHLDVGEFATKVHHTHAYQECGMVWRPAVVPTVGVRFLPGFKNGNKARGRCGVAGSRTVNTSSSPGWSVPCCARGATAAIRSG